MKQRTVKTWFCKLHTPTLLIFVLAAVLAGLFRADIVHAFSSIMPDSTIGGGNWADKYLEISIVNSSNALEARTSYTKFYFTSSSGSVQIRDADFCGSAGSSPDGITPLLNKYELFRTGSDEKLNNVGAPATSYQSLDRSTSAGKCEKDGNALVTLNISGLQPSAVEGRNGKDGATQYYVAALRVSAVSPNSGGVNAFRLGTPTAGGLVGHAVNSLAFAKGKFCDLFNNPDTTQNPCYAWGPFRADKPDGDQDAFAVQDRKGPNASNSTFKFEFAPNCNLKGDQRIYLKWFDLDAGSSNQSANPVMELWRYPRDSLTGGVRVARKDSNWASGSGRYESYGPLTVNSNYRYVWQWDNIQKTNGVQLWMPFDSANFGFKCPEPIQDKGTCTINISLPANKVIVPGQSITGSITVSNTGNQIWSVPYGVSGFPPGRSYRIASSDDSNRWGANTKRMAIKPSVTGALGPFLEAGKTTTTDPIAFTAPSDLTPGSVDMTFRIILEGGGETGKNITSCSTTFKVKENRPFLRIDGSDVWSGATFGSNGVDCPVDGYDTTKAQAAAIKTNGYGLENSLSALWGYSSSQYAALASGAIGNETPQNRNNFMGNTFPVTANGAPLKQLLFANDKVVPTTEKYGYFYGVNATVPCVDASSIYTQTQLNQQTTGSFNDLLNASGNFVSNNGDITVDSSVSISGQKVIWINGEVTINQPITYSANYTYDANGQPNIPYMMLIATKGIKIGKSVTTLDGNYVSFPTTNKDGQGSPSNSGRIDTCYNATGVNQYDLKGLTAGSCPRLIVNGSLIARNIFWKRTYGTLGGSADVIDGACAVLDKVTGAQALKNQLKDCAAEYIDFSPEAYFNPLNSLQTTTVNSVPQSSIELPPVY